METLDIVCEGLGGPLGSRESNTEVVSEGKGKKVYLVCLFDGLERDLQWGFGPAECVLGNRREKVREVGVSAWAVYLEG